MLPGDHATGGDDERQLGNAKTVLGTADVLNQGDEIGFVLLFQTIVLVVPSLVPTEAGELDALSLVVGKVGVDVAGGLLHDAQHLVVEVSRITGNQGLGVLAHTGWQEIVAEALAAPRGLDQQHLFIGGFAHEDAEAQLRADLATAGSVSRLEPAEPGLAGRLVIENPDIVALHPLALVVDQKLILLLGVVLHRVTQAVVTVALDGSLALHVGLADQDVGLDRRFGMKGGADRQESCQQGEATEWSDGRHLHESLEWSLNLQVSGPQRIGWVPIRASSRSSLMSRTKRWAEGSKVRKPWGELHMQRPIQTQDEPQASRRSLCSDALRSLARLPIMDPVVAT